MWIIFFLGLGVVVMAALAINVLAVMKDSDDTPAEKRAMPMRTRR